MRKIQPNELARMKQTASESFNDSCDIHVATTTTSPSGQVKKTFNTTSGVECGFNPTNAEQNFRGQVVTVDADAILRLPLNQSIAEKDEVTVRGQRFEIDAIQVGQTIKRAMLKRIDSNG